MKNVGLPLWSKLLAGIVVVAGTCCIAGFTSTVCQLNLIARQATDPAHIASVSKSIASFPEKLPDGFSFQMAATVLGAHMLTILYKPDDTVFMIGTKVLSAGEPELQAKKMASDLADKGIPNITDEFHIQKTGSESIAGQTMEYVTGSGSSPDGRVVSGLIGCIAIKDTKKLILIYGLTPSAKYNFDATKALLSSIKSF